MRALTIENGWLAGVTHCPSPNHDARPESTGIDLLVIHGISLPPGEFGGPYIADLFCNRLDADAHPYFAGIVGLRVSSHVLVRRDGQIIQFVGFDRRAWHAGKSCFDGRQRCNDFAIGVELEGTDDTAYAPAQYATLAGLVDCLRYHYPLITPDRITGHSDIAPGRKTDPGPAFDWDKLRRLLGQL